MNREIAKKLMSGGFPSIRCEFLGSDSLCYQNCFPTLTELIEKCGEEREFDIKDGDWSGKGKTGFHLLWENNLWSAGYTFRFDDSSEIEAEGATPEEAVARLWLAINKK